MCALVSSRQRRGVWSGAMLLLSVSCGDATTAAPEAGATATPRRVKPRTVSIELFRTTAREVEHQPGGSAPTDLDGVEVCAAKQRPAFASFEPFIDLDPPLCATSVAGQTVRLSGVPANSDIVITLAKDGYRAATITFRTDAYDVAAPAWGGVSHALAPDGAVVPWLEPEPRASPGDAIVDIWASAVWAGADFVPGEPDGVINVVHAQDVSVEIEDVEGRSLGKFSTVRERSLFVSLPEGSYAFRFSHPRMNIRAVGATAQFLIAGLSTATLDTIEVPVLAGHRASAVVDALCWAPRWDQGIEDLATCTLAPARDAGLR